MINGQPTNTPRRDVNADANSLETLVDAYGVHGVLDMLAAVCYAKAEHLEHAWQDSVSASAWRKSAAVLLKQSVLKGWVS